MKAPKGGDRRPTFYSRRFCRSVCGRTKSFRRSRNVKGNFAWDSYCEFSAGSWRVLGTFSAESRQDLCEISPPLAMRSLIGEFERFAARFLTQKVSKGFRKGVQREAKRTPGWRKGGLREPKIAPEAYQNREQNEGLHPSRFWKPPGKHWVFIFARFWLHLGSQIR